jgi:hypothetical protein
MKEKELDDYIKEMHQLKQKYKNQEGVDVWRCIDHTLEELEKTSFHIMGIFNLYT